MAKKVIWAPKLAAPNGNQDPLRWCRVGQHRWIPFKIAPVKTKLCVYCKEEANVAEDNIQLA